MIGTGRGPFIFIQVCIIGLTLIAPLSILYCASALLYHAFHRQAPYHIPLVISIIAVAETVFYIFVYTPYKFYLQREAIHPPAPSREERRELFYLCDENISDPEGYLRKWFLGAPLEEIKRENVKEFILWAFFNRGGEPGDDDEELEEYCSATEKLLGRKIEPGRGNAKSLRLTLDRVSMLHRSLIWYCCVAVVDVLTSIALRHHGFHHHRLPHTRFFNLFPFRPQTIFTSHITPAKHITYWHRPHTSTTSLPIVFIHGIGIGLYPYTAFLKELNALKPTGIESPNPNNQIGIIALEIMPVCFRITSPALRREVMCAEINLILLKHFGATQKFMIVSHSYGTVLTTHLLKDPIVAPRVGPILLIDPVSILLHLPDVAYNFTRRKPKQANEHQLYYFASMDMGVSHTLSRHFFWNESCIWKRDLRGLGLGLGSGAGMGGENGGRIGDGEGRRVSVALGGRDLIVDTVKVGRYLAGKDTDDDVVEVMRRGGVPCPIKREGRMGWVSGGNSSSRPNGNANANENTKLIDIDDDAVGDNEGERGIRGGEAELSQEAIDEEWQTREWTGKGIEVLWFGECDHAQIFDKRESRMRLIEVIRSYCQDGFE